jgi:hypothetical protein
VLDELFVDTGKPVEEVAANTPAKGGQARRKLNKLLEV